MKIEPDGAWHYVFYVPVRAYLVFISILVLLNRTHFVKNRNSIIFSLILALLWPFLLFGQISRQGVPDGITRKVSVANIPVVKHSKPDLPQLLVEDELNASYGLPERMGVSLQAGYTPENSGEWESVNNRRIWKLRIEVPEAVGLGLYFKDFKLPAGGELYVYSADMKHVIGAFTSFNNHSSGLFATQVVRGDNIIVEYSEPFLSSEEAQFTISEVLYVYRPMLFPGDKLIDLKNSGDCQVNTSCSEGDNWRDEINSVVRILIKSGFNSFWCSGALLNTTSEDYEPFIMTADHCAQNISGDYASADDVLQWMFYFKYETLECTGIITPEAKTMTGAVKIASSSPLQNNGSDFYLMLLNENIPANYEPYYAGWDISGDVSPSGVSIHHPAGDVKKISTYTTPLSNAQWGSNPDTHFKVNWAETDNGHGTTEGGSSGSPLFSNAGRVIGQLTGGESGCSNLNGPDYYGKISYSWKSNGTHDSLKLAPWLDPLNVASATMNGAYNDKLVLARFRADTNVVVIGNDLYFSDISKGDPYSWHWVFEGGEPRTSTQRNPGPVHYDRLGKYSVTLMVTNALSSDSLTREKYIRVVPRIFPNPATNHFLVSIGDESGETFDILVNDVRGQTVYTAEVKQNNRGSVRVNCQNWPSGLYVVRIIGRDFAFTEKVMRVGVGD